ncbi:MAG: type II toxin-antitoxin system HicB family antitoxin, partial [Pseudohongiellaceae bacterium]
MTNKVELHVYWSEPDQVFIVEVPDLPGCKADGATYEQAVSNAKQIIEEWIETAIALGRSLAMLLSHWQTHGHLTTRPVMPIGDTQKASVGFDH